jgi:hypothetical protein
MSGTVIVLVSDLDNSAHGEINIMESPQKAARLVETLLESGYDQERVRVFAAEEFQMQVHHRPVVSLMTSADGDGDGDDEPSGTRVHEESGQEEEAPVARAATAKAVLAEPVAAEPFVKNGVRFSSQFRPA